MANRDLNLNSLGRYAKNSDHLILEEHGHCEVPAGCGGAVLRWRNPNTGLIFLVQLYSQKDCQFFIDGKKPPTGRPLISFGDHVISLVVSELIPGWAVMGMSAIHDESQYGFPRVSRPSDRTISILSAADGSWKYSTTEPTSDAWMLPGFDDSQWPAMVMREPPQLDQKDMRAYRLKAVMKSGAQCLGISESSLRVWIRKSFTISASA